MNFWPLIFFGLMVMAPSTRAADNPAATLPQESETDQNQNDEEGEEKDIIPRRAELSKSTHPVTPVTPFPEKPPYDLAREELARAQALWAKGEAEAASDTALEAYDDLMMIRRPKKYRKKLYAERYRAAAIYVEAGIRFIQDFVKKGGSTSAALEEGRSRLEDLRDVARSYPDLNRTLNKTIESLSGTPSPQPN